MSYRLPPAGNRVPLSAGGDLTRLRAWMWPWRAHWFGSGTQALAALLCTLRRLCPGRVEVVFAAFACPSLVAAVRFAGLTPRLVDLAPGGVRMDPEALRRRVGPRTLAVIAVDLFGLPEQYPVLAPIAAGQGAFLVQDSAQGFPPREGEKPWHGDAVVISFGRGKPLNLLGGGAVLVRDAQLAEGLIRVEQAPRPGADWRYRLAALAFNTLRHPRLYPLPAALPFLHLGETRFRPVSALHPMDAAPLARLPEAAARHWRRGAEAERFYREHLGSEGPGWRALAPEWPGGLNRYPLLAADPSWRDRLLAPGGRFGMAPLYPCSLALLPGTGLSGDFPQAERIAARLLTLPTHDGVRRRDLEALAAILSGVDASRPWGVADRESNP